MISSRQLITSDNTVNQWKKTWMTNREVKWKLLQLILRIEHRNWVKWSKKINTSHCYFEQVNTVASYTTDNHRTKGYNKLPLDDSIPPQWRQWGTLTLGEVAAERRGKIPPQAIIMLSTICEIRWMVLWTKIMFSLQLTKSITDLVEWLQGMERETFIVIIIRGKSIFHKI